MPAAFGIEGQADVRGALEWIPDHSIGQWSVVAAGLGLIAFGIYSLVESLVRRAGLHRRPESTDAA